MNTSRRARLSAIRSRLDKEFRPLWEGIRADLEEIQEEEQEAYDNMPEALQAGEKGDAALSALESLEGAIGLLDSCEPDSLDEELASAMGG